MQGKPMLRASQAEGWALQQMLLHAVLYMWALAEVFFTRGQPPRSLGAQ